MQSFASYSVILIESLVVWSFLMVPLLYFLDKNRTNFLANSRYQLLIFCFYSLPIGFAFSWTKYYIPNLIDLLAPIDQSYLINLPELVIGLGETDQSSDYNLLIYALNALYILWLISALFGLAQYLVNWLSIKRYLKVGQRISISTLSKQSGLPSFYFPEKIKIVLLSDSKSPGIFGYLKPVLFLPETLISDQQSLKLAVHHELVHFQQKDPLYLHFESLIKSVFWINPIVNLLFNEIQLEREIRCDQIVLRKMPNESFEYAQLLTRLGQNSALKLTASFSSNKSALLQRLEAIAQLKNETKKAFSKIIYLPYFLILPILLGFSSYRIGFQSLNESPNLVELNKFEGLLDEDIFIVTEEPPQIIGGMQSIAANLEYPLSARQNNVQGRVFLQFIVDKEGVPQHIEVVRSLNKECDEAAIKAVKKVRFIPAKQQGRSVHVKFSLPIVFKLSN